MKTIKRIVLFTAVSLMLVSITMLGIEHGLAKTAAESPPADHQPQSTSSMTLDEPSQLSKAAEKTQMTKSETTVEEFEFQTSSSESTIKRDLEEQATTLATEPQTIGQINLEQPLTVAKHDPKTDPKPAAIDQDEVIETGILSIPKIDINTQTVPLPNYGSGWNFGLIEKEVALLGDTGRFPLDGQAMVFSAHVIDAWEFGPFFNLDRLLLEDRMSYTYKNQEFIYEVSQIMNVTPDRADLLYDDDGDQIILMTCSDYSFKTGTFEKRLLVIADLVDVQPISSNLGLNDENPIFEN